MKIDTLDNGLETQIMCYMPGVDGLVSGAPWVVSGKRDVREAAARLPDEEPIGGNGGDVAVEDESEVLDEEVLP